MIHHLDPVPFTIDNEAHLGLSETQGLLSSDGRNLVIEYRMADTIVGLVKTDSKELLIPLADVRSIRFEKKYMGLSCCVTLRTRNQHVLDAMPEAKLGAVVMKVKRGDRQTAEEFCLAVQEVIVRSRNMLLDDEIAGMLEE